MANSTTTTTAAAIDNNNNAWVLVYWHVVVFVLLLSDICALCTNLSLAYLCWIAEYLSAQNRNKGRIHNNYKGRIQKIYKGRFQNYKGRIQKIYKGRHQDRYRWMKTAVAINSAAPGGSRIGVSE